MKIYFFFFSILLCLVTNAQNNIPGILDSSFGINGKVRTASPDKYLYCYGVGQQSDGSIIAAGSIGLDASSSFFAVKYSSDGVVDSSFGQNGLATIDSLGIAQAMFVQPDDKILVAGYTADLFGPYYIKVARFNADGTVDDGFGAKGSVTVSGYYAKAISVQSDDKIIIVGADNKLNSLTMRLLPNGTLDVGFGTNGIVSTSFGSTSVAHAVAIQQDGKIVVAGQTNSNLFFGRYNLDGLLDQTFGTNGKITYSFSTGGNVIQGLAIQNDGKIVAVGTSTSFLPDTAYGILLRCLPDGSLDDNFGTAGIFKEYFPTQSELSSVVLQKDGKIITYGAMNYVYPYEGHCLLQRFTTGGLPDSTFGTNGYTFTTFDSSEGAYSVFITKDEKIAAGGASHALIIKAPSDVAIALARYNNDDESKKQILITKIRHWIQHHNGIEWTVNNNISNYVIQRSYDGIHFSSIARINTNNQSNLTYEDPMPLSGNNYYRLQTRSINGAVNYSNVIAVTNDDNTIKISPNPATNGLHIDGLSSNKTKLTVVDFAGNVKLQTQANSGSYILNIASLKAGNYLLKIESKDDVVTKSFVKE